MSKRPLLLLVPLLLVGCGSPDKANIALRKEIQQLQSQLADLNRRHAADQATIASLQGGNAAPTLPPDRLNTLFTTHGIKLGRLTTGNEANPSRPDTGVRAAFSPIDGTGDSFKAAGAIAVQVYDLSRPQSPLVAECTHSAEEAPQLWRAGLVDAYVVECPFQSPPTAREVTVKVTFTDALTGRAFTDQKVVEITPPGSGS